MNDINYGKIKKTIAFELRKQRKLKGETYDQVAKNIGTEKISARSIKSYESGKEKHLPSIEKLILLSNYYGVPIDTLVFSHNFTDDDSYTWESSFKRLGRLIYCSVIIPFENKSKDNNLPKHYFLAYDKETEIFIDRLMEFSKTKNYNFERKFKKIQFSPKDYDSLFNDFKEDKTDLSPNILRFNHMVNMSGSSMKEYLEMRKKALLGKK